MAGELYKTALFVCSSARVFQKTESNHLRCLGGWHALCGQYRMCDVYVGKACIGVTCLVIAYMRVPCIKIRFLQQKLFQPGLCESSLKEKDFSPDCLCLLLCECSSAAPASGTVNPNPVSIVKFIEKYRNFFILV